MTLLHLSQPEQVDKVWYESILSEWLHVKSACRWSFDRGWYEGLAEATWELCATYPLFSCFPRVFGESRKDENLPSLWALHSSLTQVCAALLKHYMVLKPYFTSNLLLEKRKMQGHTASIWRAVFSSVIIPVTILGLHPSVNC